MARALDRDKLLAAFDEIGRAAATAGTTLQIVVYGGSALMLASNFRFATEDADVAPLEKPLPDWLQRAVERITAANGWAESVDERKTLLFRIAGLEEKALGDTGAAVATLRWGRRRR